MDTSVESEGREKEGSAKGKREAGFMESRKRVRKMGDGRIRNCRPTMKDLPSGCEQHRGGVKIEVICQFSLILYPREAGT